MTDELSAPLESTPDPIDTTMPPAKGVTTTQIAFPALQDYFDLETPTKDQTAKLEQIWGFFAHESESIGDLLYKLRSQESRLGSPAIGQSRLDKVLDYIKVSRSIESDEQRRDAMLR